VRLLEVVDAVVLDQDGNCAEVEFVAAVSSGADRKCPPSCLRKEQDFYAGHRNWQMRG